MLSLSKHLAGGGALVLALAATLSQSAPGEFPPRALAFDDPHQLTSGPGNHLRPAWSPDGTRIAFHASRAGDNHIWTITADGSDLKQVTSGPGDDRRPAWSPDGGRIAFDSARSGSRDIWLVNAGGSGLRQITTDPGEETFAAWSPDGEQMAYYRYGSDVLDIWVAMVSRPSETRLTTNLATLQAKNCTFGCHAVSWSADGRRIAYSGGDHKSLWVMNADGSEQLPLLAGERGHFHFPEWTRAGKLVALSEELGEKAWSDIWLLDPESGDRRRLYHRIEHGGPFAWSPDGRRVAYHSPRSGSFQIYVAELADSGVGMLAAGGPAAAAIPSDVSPRSSALMIVVALGAGALGWSVARRAGVLRGRFKRGRRA